MVNQLVRIDMGHPWSSGHPNQNPKHGLPQHVVHSQTTAYNCLLKNITKGHWFSWTSTLLARSFHHTVMIMAINILPSDYDIWKSYIAKGSCCKQNMVPPLWFHPWPMMTQVATVPSRSLALCLSLYLDPGGVYCNPCPLTWYLFNHLPCRSKVIEW